MIRVVRMAALSVAISAAFTTPASAQVGVGHRVENLVVPGSAQNEPRKVKLHLWYPAEPGAYAAAPKTTYTPGLYGQDAPARSLGPAFVEDRRADRARDREPSIRSSGACR